MLVKRTRNIEVDGNYKSETITGEFTGVVETQENNENVLFLLIGGERFECNDTSLKPALAALSMASKSLNQMRIFDLDSRQEVTDFLNIYAKNKDPFLSMVNVQSFLEEQYGVPSVE